MAVQTRALPKHTDGIRSGESRQEIRASFQLESVPSNTRPIEVNRVANLSQSTSFQIFRRRSQFVGYEIGQRRIGAELNVKIRRLRGALKAQPSCHLSSVEYGLHAYLSGTNLYDTVRAASFIP